MTTGLLEHHGQLDRAAAASAGRFRQVDAGQALVDDRLPRRRHDAPGDVGGPAARIGDRGHPGQERGGRGGQRRVVLGDANRHSVSFAPCY